MNRWRKVHYVHNYGESTDEGWIILDDSRPGDEDLLKEVCEVWAEEGADMIIAALQLHDLLHVDTPDKL